MGKSVIVIGGGAAGLVCALKLARSHEVTVVEARNRLGGRVHTSHGEGGLPYELGAEFVHGKSKDIWSLIRAAKLKTHKVPDRHWKSAAGALIELDDFWEQLASVTEEIKPSNRDTSFSTFLAGVHKPRESIKLAKDFIEGFHAAPPEKASVQAIRCNEKASEKIDGQQNKRINVGYDALINFMEAECRAKGVRFQLGAVVNYIDWSETPVRVKCAGAGGDREADHVVITLPIGVLKAGGIQFKPKVPKKAEAINSLEMGMVTKVVYHFKEQFWPEANFGFIHSEDDWVPTWWADERGHTLTGWAGAEKARDLAVEDSDFIVTRGLETLSKLFGERIPRLRELLRATRTHNWITDPFSHGAYSFIPTGAMDAPKELTRPEGNKLFFAGEATDLNHQFGTVHGAISSGMRAAKQIAKTAKTS